MFGAKGVEVCEMGRFLGVHVVEKGAEVRVRGQERGGLGGVD